MGFAVGGKDKTPAVDGGKYLSSGLFPTSNNRFVGVAVGIVRSGLDENRFGRGGGDKRGIGTCQATVVVGMQGGDGADGLAEQALDVRSQKTVE